MNLLIAITDTFLVIIFDLKTRKIIEKYRASGVIRIFKKGIYFYLNFPDRIEQYDIRDTSYLIASYPVIKGEEINSLIVLEDSIIYATFTEIYKIDKNDKINKIFQNFEIIKKIHINSGLLFISFSNSSQLVMINLHQQLRMS